MKTRSANHASKEKLIKHTVDRLSALSDVIDEMIYVLDPETHEILFANTKTRSIYGRKIEGKKCYRVFQKLDRPCAKCSNEHIFGKNLGKTYVWDHQNQLSKRWYKSIYKALKWPTGKYVKYAVAFDITKQRRTESALKRSAEMFRSIVENSHNGIVICDKHFRVVYANEEAARISKYPREEIVGKDCRNFLDNNSRLFVQHMFSRANATGEKHSRHTFSIIRKDGEKREVDVKCKISQDGKGGKLCLVQILDVTENRKMERDRRRFEERLSALNVHSQKLNMTKNMKEIYKLALDAMEVTLGFEFADILIVNGKKICLAAHRGASNNLPPRLNLSSEKGITTIVARTAKTVNIADVRREKAYLRITKGIRSELAVPIKIGKNVLGVLNVESKKIAAFDEEDRKLLEILAAHTAIAINILKRREQLTGFSKKLECLMKSTTKLIHVKDMHRRLKVIAEAIRKLGWRRVVISLRNERLEGIDIVAAGLTEEEVKILLERKASGSVWQERLGPKFKRFKIDEFYYLPWLDPWVRENVHGVSPNASPEQPTTYAGVPSRLSEEEMVDWHPQDMLYAPLRTPEGKIVGILSMDDPVDGRRPSKESLTPLELFLHQAAIIIENAQLFEGLREARKQLQTYADQLEQKVEERTRALRQSQDQLLKAQRLAVIGELAGMVGHDIRNPLTSIGAATYYLKKQLAPKKSPKLQEMLTLIEKNISYSNKIVNDLLDYSRQIKLDLTETDPKSLIKETLVSVEIPDNIRVVNLTSAEPKMMVDAEKMKRAYVNIIKNAVEAMPKGGTLTIKSEKQGEDVVFAFSDTGVGMTTQTIAKLWTPLFTTKSKGMGFGLPICKGIIEAHKGAISIESKHGKGTTFIVKVAVNPKTEEGGEEVWVKQPEYSSLTMTKT